VKEAPARGAPARGRAHEAGARPDASSGSARRVAVLKGGRSLERQVSLRSGARVEDALARLGHDVIPIDAGQALIRRLREAAPDVAFIAMHGRDGEDGTVQELLEVLDIPYTGSGVLACSRCMDKVLAKHLMVEADIPTPAFYALDQTAFRELGAADALPAIEERLDFPIVVKPSRQGSALGIKFARTAADVPAALVAAFSYDSRVLLERHVAGRDLAVSILDGQPLPVVEAVPRDEEFYDFEARYEIGRTEFVCPADLPSGVGERAQELALRTYALLGCSAFARVDLMLAAADELTVLEANAIPGLTETSLLPQAAEAAGIGFDELVGRILELAGVRAAG
jgi:D-alanine-D-alanine ligase